MTTEALRILEFITAKTRCRGCISPPELRALNALALAVTELSRCSEFLNDHGHPRVSFAEIEAKLT